jgi:hypothetical protein
LGGSDICDICDICGVTPWEELVSHWEIEFVIFRNR